MWGRADSFYTDYLRNFAAQIIRNVVKKLLIALFSLGVVVTSFAQEKTKYRVIAVGSYNCENFFDTDDDTAKKDEDFTPATIRVYHTAVGASCVILPVLKK